MKTAFSKRPVRSHALRKTSLLSATALVAVGTLALPSAHANSVNYTQSGTYTDAVTVRATNSILAAAGVNAVFAGTVTYGDPASDISSSGIICRTTARSSSRRPASSAAPATAISG